MLALPRGTLLKDRPYYYTCISRRVRAIEVIRHTYVTIGQCVCLSV